MTYKNKRNDYAFPPARPFTRPPVHLEGMSANINIVCLRADVFYDIRDITVGNSKHNRMRNIDLQVYDVTETPSVVTVTSSGKGDG